MSVKSKHLSHLIRFLIAAAALYFAFKGESVKNIIRDFGGLNIFIFIIAILLNVVGNLIFVLRWLLLLRTQGVYVSYWPALKLHMLGLFYNNCLPGSVGGDALRAWYVTKHTNKKIEAAMSVFVDRAIGMACTIAMVFLSYWLMPKGSKETQFTLGADFSLASLAIKFLLASVLMIIIAAIVIAVMYTSRKLRPILFKYIFIFSIKWKLWFDRILQAIKLYCCSPLILLLAVVLTFICQSLPIYGLYLVGKDIGIPANIRYYFMFFPLSWIIGVIPISVGGAGVMELGIKGLFGKVSQVTTEQGLGLALAQRLIWLITSIPGVIIHLTGKHLPPPESENS
jgi:glycosyltransferase 2 family protein